MMYELYLLDLIGTFAFASYGAYFALGKHFDLFGIFCSAFLTAVGGGTLRCMILNQEPIYFSDPTYGACIAVGMLFSIGLFKRFHKIHPILLFLDSIGLIAFAWIGASSAQQAGLNLFGVAFCATLTAVGGGMVRDLLMDKVPEVMHRDLYASIALLFGLVYGLLPSEWVNLWTVNALFVAFLSLRLWVIRTKYNLWKPIPNPDYYVTNS